MMIDQVNGHDLGIEPGPGLFEGVDGEGWRHLTNVRKIAGKVTPRGQSLLNIVTGLLILLDAGVLYVSFAAQYRFIYRTRQQEAASLIEAGMLDLALIIFSGLGIALSLKGKSSKAVRTLIIVFAAASAGMNFAAASPGSWRSIVVYTSAPAVLAIVTDQVISVIRRYYLGKEETSAWSALGGAVRTSARISGKALTYVLATLLAPKDMVPGMRRAVLLAAPVPGKAIEVESTVVPEIDAPDDEHQDDELSEADIVAMLIADGRCPVRDDYPNRTHCCHDLPCPDHQSVDSPRCSVHDSASPAPCGIPLPCPVHDDHAMSCQIPLCPNRTPCPDHPLFATKKDHFLHLYKQHALYGSRAAASKVGTELAPQAGLQPGTGRTYVIEHLNQLAQAAKAREIAS